MEELTKRYYGIREVADLFGVNISKLRFYEKEFPMLKPRKNRAGDRIYTKEDIAQLKEILDLVEVQGYTLEGARQHLKTRSSRQTEIKQMIGRLQEIRRFFAEVRDGLDENEAGTIPKPPVF